MKCFSGREKDIGHARALVKKGTDTKIVKAHIEQLGKKGLPRAKEALKFLEDVCESVGEI